MPIYAKPTKDLMKDFAAAILQKGQAFRRSDAVAWFAENYPKIRSSTVAMHVEGMAVNVPQWRKHHQNIRPGSGHDLFFKLGQGLYRLWEPEKDGPPAYGGAEPGGAADVVEEDDLEADESEPSAVAAGREFAFERDLKNYLVRHIQSLEPGLRVYKNGDVTGVEFEAGGRFIDILAVDKDNAFVVIELKVSRGYDRVIGQLLRYVGWVKRNMAKGAPVRGIIVASNISEDLKIAASELEGVRLVEYEISFSLRPVAG